MSELLKNRVFKIVLITDLIQQTSIWIRNIALLFFVMEYTNNDPIAVSILSVFEYLPIFLFSFIGGALADRWNPKKTMITGDFLSSISIIVIMLLIWRGYWQAVFVATLVSAIVTQISLPSSLVMFKKHLPDEQITVAMAISQSTSSLYVIVGPIIGTLVYTKLGITASLTTIAVLFFCSAVVQFLLPSYKRDLTCKQTAIFTQVKEGFKYVKGNVNLVAIAGICFVIGIGQGIIDPLQVYVVIERLGLQKESIQWFYSFTGIGLLLGGTIAALLAQKLNEKIIAFMGLCLFSVGVIVEVLSVWVALTVSMRLIVAIMTAFLQVVINTLLLKLVKEEFVGRVNGIISPLLMGGILLGSLLSGVLMKTVSLIPSYISAAGFILIGALISLKLRINTNEKNNTSSISA